MLGTDLWQELDKDYEIYGADLIPAPVLMAHGDRFYKADIAEAGQVSDTVKKIKPDIVIHSAAWTDVDGCEFDKTKAFRINGEGARNVALACRDCDALLIYLSTDFVFDGKNKRPYKETDRISPINAYGESKAAGEEAIKKILEKYFILRTSWLYGKRGKNFVDTILQKAKTEKVLKVVDDQVGSPTYTRDLAAAIHALLARIDKPEITSYGTYHVSNAGSVSWYNYAKEILRLARSRAKVEPISSDDLGRPARRPVMSILDNSKFLRLTGYKMRRWKDALKDYLRS